MISPAPKPKQPQLINNDPRARSLLLSFTAVCAAFPHTNDDELRDWVGSELPWCFDLGTGEEREFICVLTSSVREMQIALQEGRRPHSKISTWSEAVKAALPPRPAFLTSVLAREWNIKADRMDRLIRRDLLIVPGLYGSNVARRILRSDAESFLMRRAIR